MKNQTQTSYILKLNNYANTKMFKLQIDYSVFKWEKILFHLKNYKSTMKCPPQPTLLWTKLSRSPILLSKRLLPFKKISNSIMTTRLMPKTGKLLSITITIKKRSKDLTILKMTTRLFNQVNSNSLPTTQDMTPDMIKTSTWLQMVNI